MTDSLTFLERIALHWGDEEFSDNIESYLSTLPPIPSDNTDDAGHDHSLHDFYKGFVALIDTTLESFQQKEGLSAEEFMARCRAEHDAGDGNSAGHRILEGILVGSSFEAFLSLAKGYQLEQNERCVDEEYEDGDGGEGEGVS